MYSWQSKNLNVIPKCNEEFEDIKGVIRLRISKKNRQHKRPKEKEQTTQTAKRKRTDNDGNWNIV